MRCVIYLSVSQAAYAASSSVLEVSAAVSNSRKELSELHIFLGPREYHNSESSVNVFLLQFSDHI